MKSYSLLRNQKIVDSKLLFHYCSYYEAKKWCLESVQEWWFYAGNAMILKVSIEGQVVLFACVKGKVS